MYSGHSTMPSAIDDKLCIWKLPLIEPPGFLKNVLLIQENVDPARKDVSNGVL